MNIKKILGIAVAVALVGGLLYFNQPQESSNTKKKVYAIYPLTGSYSAQGKEEKKALEAYMSSHKDLPFEIEYFDNESNPVKSLDISRQVSMRDKNPLFACAIGALCRPIIPTLKSINGFMLLAPSTQAENTTEKEFQRVSINHAEMNAPLINYLKPNQSVVIIHSNEEAGYTGAELVASKLKNKGVDVKAKLAYTPSDLDTRILGLKAIEHNSDAILIIGAPCPGFINVIKTLKAEQNYKGDILCDVSLRTPSIMEALGNTTNGIFVPILPTKRIYEQHMDAAEALTNAGLELYTFPIMMWDLLDVITFFIDNNIPFTQEEFVKLGKWSGISTDIEFFPEGNSTYHFILAKIQDGKFIPVEE